MCVPLCENLQMSAAGPSGQRLDALLEMELLSFLMLILSISFRSPARAVPVFSHSAISTAPAFVDFCFFI